MPEATGRGAVLRGVSQTHTMGDDAMTTTTRSDVVEFELDLGRCQDGGRVFASVRLDWRQNGPKPAGTPELGIAFDHTPKGRRRHQNETAYGQLDSITFTPGTLGYAVRFVWAAYHLGGMHMGCEHQRAAGWEREGYDAHKSEPCPVCGYRFGSAWNVVPLPQDVLELVLSWQRTAQNQPDDDENAWKLPHGTLTLAIDGRVVRHTSNPEWAKDMNAYGVRLTYTPTTGEARTLSLPYYQGQGIKIDPTLDGVMSTLISDANNAWETFEDWCAELGMDPDSRQAKATHAAVQKQDSRLRELLGDDYQAAISGDDR